MTTHSEKLRTCIEAYRSGIYTKKEAIGIIIDLLMDAPDFQALWGDVPDWAQEPIWDFIKSCDESTVLYNSSSKSAAPISPRLLELKNWLTSQMGKD